MKPQYAIQIFWSNEDRAYLAVPAELPGCAADGETPEEALANLRQVIDEWIEVAKAEGREVPEPMSREDFAEAAEKAQAQSRQYIENEVKEAVLRILRQMAAAIPAQRDIYRLHFSGLPNELEQAGFGRR